MRTIISSLTALAGLLSALSTLSEPYIELTTSHFTDTATSNIASVEAGTMSATRYIEWTLQKINEEQERAEACISNEVAQDVMRVVGNEAGTKMASRSVQKGQQQFCVTNLRNLRSDHWTDLADYPLCSRSRSNGRNRCNRAQTPVSLCRGFRCL